ncbi:lamin tail domain-containing protein, partial [candidate division KSB1 bacterium]|nr:lamin tail domain-containing protein [candidate division KSB1 bacterium]
MKKLLLLLILSGILLVTNLFAQDHLLITEFVITPTAGEFVEIYNPTNQTVDLSHYYITDATFAGGNHFYYNLVTGVADSAGGGGFGDWNARFPDGASIAPGEHQTIAMVGDSLFSDTYGVLPT